MTQLSIIEQSTGCFIIDGDLTFATIDRQSIKSVAFLTASKHVMIDLGRVANTDSAGLALMIEWIKHARHHRTQLNFKHIPEQLLNLAKLSGFDKTSHFATQTTEDLPNRPLSFTDTL